MTPKKASFLETTMDPSTLDPPILDNNEFGTNTQDPRSSPIRADTMGEDEVVRLQGLATEVRDQDDLERDIGRQVRSLRLPS